MMKPFPQRDLTAEKRIYNDRHSRARRLFGIIANRWRVFRSVILLPPGSIGNLVEATVVLDNYLRSGSSINIYCPPGLIHKETAEEELIPGSWRSENISDVMLPLENSKYGKNAGVTVEGKDAGVTVEGKVAGVTVEGKYAGVTVEGKDAGVTVEGKDAGVTVEGKYAGVTVEGKYAGVTVEGKYAGVTVEGKDAGVTVEGKDAGVTVEGKDAGVTVEGKDAG